MLLSNVFISWRFAQICSLRIRWNIYGKHGKCHICLVIYTPCFLVCKCGTYHLCHMFTPQYLHICDIFARSKFVQILFSSSELINLFAQLILACLLLNCICVIDLRGTVNGAWSTDGCTLLLINSSRVTCHCNHLTNFALLLRVDSDSVVVSEAY